MKHGTASRRSRNRGSNGGGGNRQGQGFTQNRNHVFDSNGPDVRIRGTAYQIHEKYIALAKDAASSGDRVLSESYMQYAEHYLRIINGWTDYVSAVYEENGYISEQEAYHRYTTQRQQHYMRTHDNANASSGTYSAQPAPAAPAQQPVMEEA